ncbi:hypothetical protein Y032_0240g3365 [Ancylostoma ceylanicum]|uniref:Uncharacterized protein n=1 Tax=Ancylostoma ceylanicum TaxID=53326 RepID=A0A016SF38_9BILA|nr:hypothetical protein Y032_0240g3365 [Ancylostoma ceylanicum]
MVTWPKTVESFAARESAEKHASPSSYAGDASERDIGAIYALSRDVAYVMATITAFCATMTEASHVASKEIKAPVKAVVHTDVILSLVIIGNLRPHMVHEDDHIRLIPQVTVRVGLVRETTQIGEEALLIPGKSDSLIPRRVTLPLLTLLLALLHSTKRSIPTTSPILVKRA